MNSNEVGLFAPSLPAYMLWPVALLTAILVFIAIARLRDRSAAFVIGSAWLRYIMSAFHTLTYRPLLAGMSGNALASTSVAAIGFFAIDWRNLALRALLPIYALVAIALVSWLVNRGSPSGLITVLVKYGYLTVVMLAVFGAMKRARDTSFMTSMLWAFAPVIIFQALSVMFGISKDTEADENAVSYIGGYNHEAVFSVMLATCLTAACFADRANKHVRLALVVISTVGIVLANYRTTLVAIAPLLVMYFASSSLRRFPLRDRPFIVSALLVFGALAIGLVSIVFAERFQDVSVATSGDVNFFKPPDQYSVDETRLLSGRPHIWSMYIYGWLGGQPLNHLIGFGPESWSEVFPLYAHNTLVNYLYEYGIVGVVGVLVLWFSMLAAALRVRHPQQMPLVGAHFTFLLLNMSTMPMWMIEGNLLYGLICGYTLYLLWLQSPKGQKATKERAQPAVVAA